MTKVRIINPTTFLENNTTRAKLCVCAYCRVSTDSEEQHQSFVAQVNHYTKMIESNPAWQSCGMYIDSGISGTSKNKRDEFQRLIRDCEDQKIDLVITKSISRFARNTLDCIDTIRKLKTAGVAVFFEKENINTKLAEGELILTVLGSLAQEESVSISKNNRWAMQSRFKRGEWNPTALPYGYRKTPAGEIIIDKKESKIVRCIFNNYLNGIGVHDIAMELTNKKIPKSNNNKSSNDPEPAGISKTKEISSTGNIKLWSDLAITDILKNERYKGDLLLQKTFTSDSIPFTRKRNKGQMAKYQIENNHPAIISREQFEKVKEIMDQRKKLMGMEDTDKFNNRYPFSSKIRCGECAGIMKRVTNSDNNSGSYISWSCRQHIRDKEKCSNKTIRDDEIKRAFIILWNKLLTNYKKILLPFMNDLKRIRYSINHKQYMDGCNNGIMKLTEQSLVLGRLRSKGYMDFVLFQNKNNEIQSQIEEIKKKRQKLQEENLYEKEIWQTKTIISLLENSAIAEEFISADFEGLVDHVIVNPSHAIVFVLKNGLELGEP